MLPLPQPVSNWVFVLRYVRRLRDTAKPYAVFTAIGADMSKAGLTPLSSQAVSRTLDILLADKLIEVASQGDNDPYALVYSLTELGETALDEARKVVAAAEAMFKQDEQGV